MLTADTATAIAAFEVQATARAQVAEWMKSNAVVRYIHHDGTECRCVAGCVVDPQVC